MALYTNSIQFIFVPKICFLESVLCFIMIVLPNCFDFHQFFYLYLLIQVGIQSQLSRMYLHQHLLIISKEKKNKSFSLRFLKILKASYSSIKPGWNSSHRLAGCQLIFIRIFSYPTVKSRGERKRANQEEERERGE